MAAGIDQQSVPWIPKLLEQGTTRLHDLVDSDVRTRSCLTLCTVFDSVHMPDGSRDIDMYAFTQAQLIKQVG